MEDSTKVLIGFVAFLSLIFGIAYVGMVSTHDIEAYAIYRGYVKDYDRDLGAHWVPADCSK